VARLHRRREGGEQLGVSVGSSVILPASIAACSAHLGGREQHRELGPGEAAILLGAAEQSSLRAALDGAVQPAALLEDLDRRGQLRQGGGPPRSAIDSASVCSRLSSSTIAATSSVISASRRCAPRIRAGPRSSRG
jgi:hypothetical protein